MDTTKPEIRRCINGHWIYVVFGFHWEQSKRWHQSNVNRISRQLDKDIEFIAREFRRERLDRFISNFNFAAMKESDKRCR